MLDPALFKAIVAIAPVTDLAKLKAQYSGWMSARVANDFIGSGPHISEGSPARNAAKISAPVLMFHGSFDRNVEIGHSQMMANQLRDVGKKPELVIYPKLDHYLEDSAVRTEMLEKSSAFLKTQLQIK